MTARLLAAVIVVISTVALSAAAVGAEPTPSIAIAESVPTQGEAVIIVLREPVGRLEAVYAPNSKVSRRQALEPLAKDPRSYSWTPERAGIVTLEAYPLAGASAEGKPIATKKLSVAFDGSPVAGVLIMLVAGVILFGGAFLTLRSIMHS